MASTPVETTEDALHRGMQRARVFDWSSAVEAFRKAVALDPDNVEARFRLGWALWNQAEADKPSLADMAVAYGAQVLGFDQTARDGKRKFQTYRQRLTDSVHYLRSVIERDENRANAYFIWGKPCLRWTARRRRSRLHAKPPCSSRPIPRIRTSRSRSSRVMFAPRALPTPVRSPG